MILFIQRINFINVLFIFFARLFFKRIFFFNSSLKFRNKKFFSFLKRINIIWVSYEDYYVKNHTIIKRNSILFAQDFKKKLTENLWTINLKEHALSRDQFEMMTNNLLLTISEEYYEYKKFAEEIISGDKKIFLLTNNNFITKNIYKNSRFINLNIFDLTILNFILTRFIKLIFKLFIKNLNKKKEKFKKFQKNIGDFKIVFFPHKGINPGYLSKDYFYSKKNIDLNPKNILHIEWNINEVDELSQNYYNNNNIPVIEWSAIKSSSILTIIFNKILILFFLNTGFKNGFTLSFLLTLELVKIILAKEKINNLKNTNTVLVGYEYLFPTSLNIAIVNSKKKIVTIRDRRLLEKLGVESSYDKYFTTYKSDQLNTEYIGNIRMRNFHEEKKTSLENRDKEFKLLNCLVLIDHSTKDWYTNGKYFRPNWKNNIKCLEDVLAISKIKKEINFFIKAKNNYWESLSAFEKIMQNINNSKNVSIIDNIAWSINKCINDYDFTIGKYTSLMDDIAYMNKPIIIFDDDLYPINYLKINKDLFAKNQNELNNKINELILNPNQYSSKMEHWRDDISLKFSQEDFEEKLKKII